MANSSERAVAPSTRLHVGEVSFATGINVRRVHRMIDDGILPRYACAELGKRRAIRGFAVPLVSFCAAFAGKFDRRFRFEVMRFIADFTRKNWTDLLRNPRKAKRLRFDSDGISISAGVQMSRAMDGLGRWVEAKSRIVENPNMRGGIPTIRGTRVGVREVAGYVGLECMDDILKHYPTLTRKDLEAAAMFAKAFPRPTPRRILRPDQKFLVSKIKADLHAAA